MTESNNSQENKNTTASDAAIGGAQAAAARGNATETKQPNPSVNESFDIVLASASPRRQQLLKREGVRFSVRAANVNETLEPDLLANPSKAAQKLAERKAGAIVQEILNEGYVGMLAVIGADTMVVCNNKIFGKPKNIDHARNMLSQLQGNTHQVVTGVSLWLISAPTKNDVSLGFRSFTDEAQVTFHTQTTSEIDAYLALGESFDKAGAYAAQGEGAKLIKNISGSLDTVIGLPVKRLIDSYPEIFKQA